MLSLLTVVNEAKKVIQTLQSEEAILLMLPDAIFQKLNGDFHF